MELKFIFKKSGFSVRVFGRMKWLVKNAINSEVGK